MSSEILQSLSDAALTFGIVSGITMLVVGGLRKRKEPECETDENLRFIDREFTYPRKQLRQVAVKFVCLQIALTFVALMCLASDGIGILPPVS